MTKKIIFGLFFVSGFCALLYQTVWLRLAFAAFGINAQVISVVVSVFMAGLVLGSYLSGRFILPWSRMKKIESIYLYALAELGVGVGALVVPLLFNLGKHLLLASGQTNSVGYLILSGLTIAVSMLPWCFLMGCTIPLIMDFVKQHLGEDPNIFSYLYWANTFGAMAGVVVTAVVLIEMLGFHDTLVLSAILNFVIATVAYLIAGKFGSKFGAPQISEPALSWKNLKGKQKFSLSLLFATGFTSVGFEVVWNRMFTPVLKTSVYAFAFILFVYLLGTCLGLLHYRIDLKRRRVLPTGFILLVLSGICVLQLWMNDPRIGWGVVGVALCVLTISYVLGYLTPKQVDELSLGNARIAGMAYAVNLIGCILGPLVASYILLPLIGSKFAILILALPIVALLLRADDEQTSLSFDHKQFTAVIMVIFLLTGWLGTTFEEALDVPNKIVKNDYNATVMVGQTDPSDERSKLLYVNGISMTLLTPITKVMADFPLALEPTKPQNVLVICLGMGTTFRSVSTWGVKDTVVELTPSVGQDFPFFFSDANQILANPNNKIVIDDGRRYLERTKEKYDLIVIDPPPPVEAAGSSLLYSKEFYEVAKEHLTASGILAQWYPQEQGLALSAVARSIVDEFPYVETYKSLPGWGYHFFASNNPINVPSAEQIVKNMSEATQKDLMEWNDDNDPNITARIQRILSDKQDINSLLSPDKNIEITDDQPYNEYYLLRGSAQ